MRPAVLWRHLVRQLAVIAVGVPAEVRVQAAGRSICRGLGGVAWTELAHEVAVTGTACFRRERLRLPSPRAQEVIRDQLLQLIANLIRARTAECLGHLPGWERRGQGG